MDQLEQNTSLKLSDNPDKLLIIKKIAVAISIVFLIAAAFYIYFYINDTDELNIPLEVGTVYKYDGKYLTHGSQKTITMTAPEHKLIVERIIQDKGEKIYILAFWVGNQRVSAFALVRNEQGIFETSGGKRVLLIPAKVKRGQKWEFNYASSMVEAEVKRKEQIKTCQGTMNARRIFYQSQERHRVTLWVTNNVGFVAINYSYIQDGTSRAEANLCLSGIGNMKDEK
jgi:hypothetical protein